MTALAIDLDDLRLVGRGRTADVYAWRQDRVLKLFHNGFSQERVRREALATRIAHQAGLAAPRVGGLVRIAGRLGIIYERLDGPTMLNAMRGNLLRVGRLARQMGAMHAAMHEVRGDGLINLLDNVRWSIAHAPGIDETLRASLLGRLERLPHGDALCHGDCHPDNVMMTARGPVFIDWMTAACGNPMADVARTLLMVRSGAPPGEFGKLEVLAIRVARCFMYRAYLRGYRQLCDAPEEQIAAWRPIMAAARLTEDIPATEKAWLRRVAAGEA